MKTTKKAKMAKWVVEIGKIVVIVVVEEKEEKGETEVEVVVVAEDDTLKK